MWVCLSVTLFLYKTDLFCVLGQALFFIESNKIKRICHDFRSRSFILFKAIKNLDWKYSTPLNEHKIWKCATSYNQDKIPQFSGCCAFSNFICVSKSLTFSIGFFLLLSIKKSSWRDFRPIQEGICTQDKTVSDFFSNPPHPLKNVSNPPHPQWNFPINAYF